MLRWFWNTLCLALCMRAALFAVGTVMTASAPAVVVGVTMQGHIASDSSSPDSAARNPAYFWKGTSNTQTTFTGDSSMLTIIYSQTRQDTKSKCREQRVGQRRAESRTCRAWPLTRVLPANSNNCRCIRAWLAERDAHSALWHRTNTQLALHITTRKR